MALVVNHNIPAIQAYNAVNTSSTALERSIQKLSTGLRINSAADDAAGLAISEKMRAQIRGLDRAVMNSQDGISMIQTAEGALVETQSILQRMRELSIQAANDTLTQQDRGYIQQEIDQLREEVSRIGNTTQFNKKKLLDGSAAALWSSDRQTTRAIINGGLRTIDQFGQKSSAEGNYVLDINATAGKGQVQKSDVFTIKHKDVIMRLNANTQAGINGVRVNDVPAGEYSVTVGQGYELDAGVVAPPTAITMEDLLTRMDVRIQNYSDNALDFTLRIASADDIDDVNGTITFTIVDRGGLALANDTITLSLEGAPMWGEGNSQLIGTGAGGSVILVNGDGDRNASLGNNTLTLAELTELKAALTATPNLANEYEITVTADAVDTAAVQRWVRQPGFNIVTGTFNPETANLGLNFASNAGITAVAFSLTWDNTATQWVVSDLRVNGGNVDGTFNVVGDSFTVNGQVFQLDNLPAVGTAAGERVTNLEFRFENPPLEGASLAVTGSGSGALSGNIIITTTGAATNVPEAEFTIRVTDVTAANGATMNIGVNINGVYHTAVTNWNGVAADKAQFSAGGYNFEVDFSNLTNQLSDIAGGTAGTGTNNSYLDQTDIGIVLSAGVTGTGTMTGVVAAEANLVARVPEEAGAAALENTDNARLVGHYGNSASLGIVLNASEADQNASILLEVVTVDTLSNSIVFKATANLLSKEGKTDTRVTNITLKEGGALTFDNLGITLSAMLREGTFTDSVSSLKVGDKMAYNVVPYEFEEDEDKVIEIDGRQSKEWTAGWGTEAGTSVSTQALRYTVNVNEVSGQELHLRNFYINQKDGTVYTGNVVLDLDNQRFAMDNLDEGTSLATFEAAFIGQVAKEDVKLRDLDKFWNSEGRFLLKDPQTLTITQGDGTRTKVTLYATDTLKDVATKLNQAVAQNLGQARLLARDSAGTKAADSFVTFVNEKGQRSESVAGTFVIRSIIAGSNGELNFAGDQELLNALSMNEIQAAEENSFTVSVWEAHFGRPVEGASNIKISGNKLIGAVHPNVDVIFDPMANVNVEWNGATNSFKLFKDPNGSFQTIVHLADATTVFQIGANEGEDMGINIGDMRAEALGLNGVLVTDRDAASRSITIIDNALDRVSSQRANLGAYQNRLEHTINNLTVASQNLTASESRIRDTDMAKEMMNFTKLQIMLQAGTNMLAQANALPQNVLGLIR